MINSGAYKCLIYGFLSDNEIKLKGEIINEGFNQTKILHHNCLQICISKVYIRSYFKVGNIINSFAVSNLQRTLTTMD